MNKDNEKKEGKIKTCKKSKEKIMIKRKGGRKIERMKKREKEKEQKIKKMKK